MEGLKAQALSGPLLSQQMRLPQFRSRNTLMGMHLRGLWRREVGTAVTNCVHQILRGQHGTTKNHNFGKLLLITKDLREEEHLLPKRITLFWLSDSKYGLSKSFKINGTCGVVRIRPHR